MFSWVLGEEPQDSFAVVFNETQLCFYSTQTLKSSIIELMPGTHTNSLTGEPFRALTL